MSSPNGTTAGGRGRCRAPNAPPPPRSNPRRLRRSDGVAEPETFTVELNGFSSRIWKAGSGPTIGFIAGFGGLPRWIPFLDALAQERTVIVPPLPGFPGGERGHTVLDNHLDWVLATHLLLHKAGLDGADLAGSGPGGSLAAEIAAIWPQSVKRLA